MGRKIYLVLEDISMNGLDYATKVYGAYTTFDRAKIAIDKYISEMKEFNPDGLLDLNFDEATLKNGLPITKIYSGIYGLEDAYISIVPVEVDKD